MSCLLQRGTDVKRINKRFAQGEAHGGSLQHLLTEATPAASPQLPKPCHANPTQAGTA